MVVVVAGSNIGLFMTGICDFQQPVSYLTASATASYGAPDAHENPRRKLTPLPVLPLEPPESSDSETRSADDSGMSSTDTDEVVYQEGRAQGRRAPRRPHSDWIQKYPNWLKRSEARNISTAAYRKSTTSLLPRSPGLPGSIGFSRNLSIMYL